MLGEDFVNQVVCVDYSGVGLCLYGWIVQLYYLCVSVDQQYLYVNGCLVCDCSVVYVVKMVYGDVLYYGCQLVYVLFFELDLICVDVNVYLVKYEVCFCDLWLVYDFVYCMLKDVLVDICVGMLVQEIGVGFVYLVDVVVVLMVLSVGVLGFGLVCGVVFGLGGGGGGFFGWCLQQLLGLQVVDVLVVYVVLYVMLVVVECVVVLLLMLSENGLLVISVDVGVLLLGYVIVQLYGIYILVENVEGLIVVDMYVVYECIGYECLKNVYDGIGLQLQLLLVLIMLVVGECEVDIVESEVDILVVFGFEVIWVGFGLLYVCSILVLLVYVELEGLLCDVLIDLCEYGQSCCVVSVCDELLLIMVCYGVVCVNWCLIVLEMNVLLCDMEIIEWFGQCNYG